MKKADLILNTALTIVEICIYYNSLHYLWDVLLLHHGHGESRWDESLTLYWIRGWSPQRNSRQWLTLST